MILVLKPHPGRPIPHILNIRGTVYALNPSVEMPDDLGALYLRDHPDVFREGKKGEKIDPKEYRVKDSYAETQLLEVNAQLTPENKELFLADGRKMLASQKAAEAAKKGKENEKSNPAA